MPDQNTDGNLTRYRRFNVIRNGEEWDGSYVSMPDLGDDPEELSRQALQYAHVAQAAERATDVDWWLEVLQRHGYFEDLERAVWRLARSMVELGEDDGSDPKPEDIDLGHVCGLAAVRRKVREAIRLEFADPLMRRHFAAFVGVNITAWTARRAEQAIADTGRNPADVSQEEYDRWFQAVWEDDNFLPNSLDECFWLFAQREAARAVEPITQDPDTKAKLDRLFDRVAQEARRRTAKRLPALPPSTQTTIREIISDALVSVDNSAVYHSFRSAITCGRKTFLIPSEGFWPTATLDTRRQSVRAIAQLKPHPTDVEPFLTGPEISEWQHRMAQKVMALDDLTADVLDVISALWLKQATHPDIMANLTADDFLKLRGLKANPNGDGRRGGFKDEVRRDVAARIEALRNTWIRVFEMEVTEEEQGKRGPIRKRKKWAGESSAIVVSSRIGQAQLGGGIDPYGWRVRPGDVFARFLMGPGRQTALLSLKALEYDPYRQRWEKRLTRYLAWLWRIRQDGAYADPVTVQTLLEATGEGLSKSDPIRTKERLEKALDTLQQDGVIAGWQYDTRAEEAIVGQRGWANVWLAWKITIEPPESIQSHYRQIPEPTAKKILAPPTPTTLSHLVKEARTALGLSQLQAAEEIGIDNTLLSRIEKGKMIGPKTQRRLETWLARKRAEVSSI